MPSGFVRLGPILVGVVAATGAEVPGVHYVWSDSLAMRAGPDSASAALGDLRKGDRVMVVREGPGGWRTILPPAGAYSWVERSMVTDLGDGRARVLRATAVRPGGGGNRLPTGIWTTVQAGTILRLLEVRPLVVHPEGGERRVWVAVEPPSGEVRYVRADGLTRLDPGRSDPSGDPPEDFLTSARPSTSFASSRVPAIGFDPAFVEVGPPLPPGLGPSFAAELARAEAAHRATLALPMEAWRLDRVRADYARLAEKAGSPPEREAANSRLEQVDRQAAAAQAARKLADLAERGRTRDAKLAALRGRLDDLARGGGAPFEVVGFLQRSSRIVDGHQVYAIIGEEGDVSAYIQVPPGLDVEPWLASRVGVRGDVHYDEAGRALSIWAKDVVPLDEAP